ncbi:hypothetical protein GQX73_g3929 [Xylaria multiplex]|uniref:Rhodopsin domain-containing protein n=1 Tax=Xylaria multiplex TaxID=323545 RepID=A0A7C8MRJ8_9PEZI|nr:hypothetical protein GQX73_g3929 [Xylaria multiplex]
MSSDTSTPKTDHDLTSMETFKAIVWVGFGLMIVAFAVRAYIRIVSFRRLFLEDWFMLLALVIYLTIAIVSTIYLRALYNLSHIDDEFVPGPAFETDTMHALQAYTGIVIIARIGLWIIKINFLLFFYRLSYQLPKFRIVLWVVLCIVIATGIVEIGITQYSCLLTDFNTLVTVCSTVDNIREGRRRFIVAIVLDVLTDVLMIIFPISLLWISRMNIRQKLALSGIFLLIAATIAITIGRAGVFSATPDDSTESPISLIALEYFVAFLVACAISFRSLFTQRQNKATYAAEQRARKYHVPTQNRGRDSAGKMQRLYNTILDTCKTLEGVDIDEEKWELPLPPSGSMMVDFTQGEQAGDWGITSEAVERIHTPTSMEYGESGRLSDTASTIVTTRTLADYVPLGVHSDSTRQN